MKTQSNSIVSVITPVYNGESYIKNTIEAILSSTYRNIELILVNDGSTDASLSICKFYAEKDQRVKVVNKNNGGIFDARNAALEVATGKYFTFVDQDDFIHPEGVRLLVETMEKDNSDMVVGSLATFYEKEVYLSDIVVDRVVDSYEMITERIIRPIIFYTDHMDENAFIKGWNVLACLFKKDIQLANNIKFRRYVDYEDDLIFYVDYIDNVKKVSMINSIVYIWRCNLKSESHSYKWIPDYLRKVGKYQEYIEDVCMKRGISTEEMTKYKLDMAGLNLIKYMDSLIYNYKLSNTEKAHMCKDEVKQYGILEKMKKSKRIRTLREKIYYYFLSKNWYLGALYAGTLTLRLSNFKSFRMRKYRKYRKFNLKSIMEQEIKC